MKSNGTWEKVSKKDREATLWGLDSDWTDNFLVGDPLNKNLKKVKKYMRIFGESLCKDLKSAL